MKDEFAVGGRTGKEDNEYTQFFCVLLLKGTEKCAVPRGAVGSREVF